MGRTLLAAVVGGILVFAWGAVSHMVLGLTDGAFKQVPQEADFTKFVKENVREPGLYAFPYVTHAELKDAAAEDAFKAKYKAGPNGILVRGRDGEDPMTMRELGLELASDIVAALLAALVVGWAGVDRSFAAKVFFVTVMGLFAWVSQNASYEIWYRFPWEFEKGELIDAVASWFLGGVAIAAILKRSARG